MAAPGSFLVRLFKSQYLTTIPSLKHDFTDQVIIVTGANTGLGLEAARHFVRLNAAKVIIACRTVSKGEAAKQSIEASTKRTGIVEVWELDLNSYASVKAFAQRANTLDRLDVLLENAGIGTMKWSVSEGNETTMTTNVVSTFLLGFLLLPKLKETERKTGQTPHLVIVASDTHEYVDLVQESKSSSIFDHLNDRSKFTSSEAGKRYPKSKLMEVLTVRALTEQQAPAGYPVVINYVNPGFCRSEIMREMEWARMAMYFLLNARSSEVGGELLVMAATMGKESHGKFITNGQLEEPSAWVRSEDGRKAGERLWQELIVKLEQIEPDIMSKL